MPGPIPKRSEELVRENKPDFPITKVETAGPARIPELGFEAHPLVVSMYDSLKNSAQKLFYEPSDWEYARTAMWVMNDMLTVTLGKAISSMKLSALDSMFTKLLMTEGDRRRARIEIQRAPSGQPQLASVTSIEEHFQKALGLKPGDE